MNGVVSFFNEPAIKEGIKNVAGAISCAFGVVELYDIYQIMTGVQPPEEADPDLPEWVQIASKVAIVCAKISLILSAGVSRPGVFMISIVIGVFFSTEQLEALFGPNTCFSLNPWHPRHVCSIAAVILSLPSLLLLGYQAVNWLCEQVDDHCFTDVKIQMMALFNTVTSRPVLHLGNRLCRNLAL
jgi:hypothetical protein